MVNIIFDFCPSIPNVSLAGHSLTTFEIHHQVNKQLELIGYRELNYYLLYNGKLLSKEEVSDGSIHVIPRLCGGKGGFGSMLRAIGAQIEKTTNREACRDLSGRRLRDINEEKRLKKWISEQAEREQEALLRKQKKLEKLNQVVKHDFKDEEYFKARTEMPEKIHEAVEEGLKASIEEASSSGVIKDEKPKEDPKKKKKRKLWVDDLLKDSDISSESEEESPKKKAKVS